MKHKCDKHSREADRRRGTATERGYGTEWRKIRKAYLQRHPYCEDAEGCIAPATDVHHLHGLGPKGDNSDASLQALCHSHHSRITAREQGGAWGVRPD
jgi:5-methylcytosine-specific restriction enzyme A